jgi:hypothetical protein
VLDSATKAYTPELHGEIAGKYSHIRRTRDYAYHTNYTIPRQQWQDSIGMVHMCRAHALPRRCTAIVGLCCAVDRIVDGQVSVSQPWMVFTAGIALIRVLDGGHTRRNGWALVWHTGAMGSGKGHAVQWLSTNGIFPLENLCRIDPDHFKSVMPEWQVVAPPKPFRGAFPSMPLTAVCARLGATR